MRLRGVRKSQNVEDRRGQSGPGGGGGINPFLIGPLLKILFSKTGLIIVAVRKDHERGSPFVFNPSASTVIEADDDLIVLGDEEQIERLRVYLS